MSQQIIKIKPSIFHAEMELLLDSGFIQCKSHRSKKTNCVTIQKQDIDGFRYGVKWITGYAFNIGRTYCIDVKAGDEILQLRIRSVYGIRKQQIHEKYHLLINALFETYFAEQLEQLLSIYHAGADIALEGLIFSQKHIYFPKNNINVKWADLGTKNYRNYFALFDKCNPNHHEVFYYLTDWNVALIDFLIFRILSAKGILKNHA